MSQKISIVSFILVIMSSVSFASSNIDVAILDLQQEWAIANYETPESDLEKSFELLTKKAEQLVTLYPDNAEPLIWQAIIVSSDAGKNGGLGALGKVKKAKKLLLEAEEINPNGLNGSIYTSLGSLYYQVPGWPIGFGNDDKAEEYLKKALDINPNGIEPNFFYADYLLEQDRNEEAEVYFNKALSAEDRPNRAHADKGRRAEINAKLQKLSKH